MKYNIHVMKMCKAVNVYLLSIKLVAESPSQLLL